MRSAIYASSQLPGVGVNDEDDVPCTCIMLHQINKYKTIINQFMCVSSAL